MTDWMAIPNAIIRLDDELTKLGKKVQDALRGVYDREDETKERITALEAKVQDLQGQLRRADNNIAGVMRKTARESGITLPSNVTEQVLDGGVREQEQQEGWSWSLDHCDFVHTSDTGVSHASVGEIASCLNAAGITPDTSDDELAAMARLKEMRARGLDLINRAVQVWGDDDTFGNDLAGWISELLLGEGE